MLFCSSGYEKSPIPSLCCLTAPKTHFFIDLNNRLLLIFLQDIGLLYSNFLIVISHSIHIWDYYTVTLFFQKEDPKTVETLKDEIAKLETKQLSVFVNVFSSCLIYYA